MARSAGNAADRTRRRLLPHRCLDVRDQLGEDTAQVRHDEQRDQDERDAADHESVLNDRLTLLALQPRSKSLNEVQQGDSPPSTLEQGVAESVRTGDRK